MTRKDLETAEKILEWAEHRAQFTADPKYPGCYYFQHDRETAEWLAEAVRLRAEFNRVLEQARIDARAAREEGYNRSNREFVFPFDDFDVAEEIVNTLRAAMRKP